MPGKRQVFSDEENRVLREELRKYMADREAAGNKISQTEMGQILGIEQQNVARLKNIETHERTGFNRDTANRLAQHLGFNDAEHLLLERGVLAEMKEIPGGAGWSDRDVAVRIALKIGYDSVIIQAIVSRYASPDYRSKPMRWWMDHFVLEGIARRDEPAQPTTRAMDKPAVRRRAKRSGTDG